MAEKNRTALKTYFEIGKRPTQEQFADLLDSVINKLEDGISVNDNNNIGIGTANPSTRLEVVTQDSWNIPPFRIGSDDSNEPAVDFKSGTDTFSIAVNNGTTNAFQIDHTAVENSLVIRDGGNIGIGTTNPNAKLEIATAPTSYEAIFRATVADAPEDYFSIQNSTGADNQFIPLLKGYHASDNRGALFLSGEIPPEQDNGDKAVVYFDASQPAGPVITRPLFQWTNYEDIKMTMDVQGNVGIGTTNPGAKLEIAAAPTSYEAIFRATVADAPEDYFSIQNGTGMNNQFTPWLKGYRASDNGVALYLSGEIPPEQDNGDIAVVHFDARRSSGSVITRPLFQWRSYGSIKMTMDVQGNIGIGTTDPGADKLDVRGRCYSSGGWQTTNADYAEYFETQTGNAIPVGTAVAVGAHGKIHPAEKGEIPIGIVSGSPGILGNSPKEWPGKYLRDAFGQVIMEEYEEDELVPKIKKAKKTRKKNVAGKAEQTTTKPQKEEIVRDSDGQPVMVKSGKTIKKQRQKLNPEYDETREYIPRQDRDEWCCVGLLGQLPLRKGQPVAPGWVKLYDISDQAAIWLVK